MNLPRNLLRCAPIALLVVALLTSDQDSASKRVIVRFGTGKLGAAFEPQHFRFSPEVVYDDKQRVVRLARSVLLAEEMGATDFHQTESLKPSTQVKKVFHLDSTTLTEAEVLFFGTAQRVQLNGKDLPQPMRVPSTGWSRVPLSLKTLRSGENELIFRDGGQLLLEPGRQPGRSYKSLDGGRTWSNQALGKDGSQLGEYLIRLRLGRHAPSGWAMSEVFDLWTVASGPLPGPGKVRLIQSLTAVSQQQPQGTQLVPRIRTGSTPAPDEKHWTPWVNLDRDYLPEDTTARHRWAQLRFELHTSRADVSPHLPREFALAFDFEPDKLPDAGKLTLRHTPTPEIATTSIPFVYETPNARLKLLRERYKLDEVIAPGKTEMEQLMLLRYWVRNQWHTAWGGHPAAWMPPWDALIVLESCDRTDCLTMCTHYAAVFTQCCLALGWNARHCILDHHCVAEVYVNEHRRWVMMDAGNSAQRADVGLHFERDGVPLSALDLHRAYHSGKTDGITVHFTPARLVKQIEHLCRPAPVAKKPLPPRPDTIPLAELRAFPVCQLENYRRYAFPARNNYLTSLLPGELYQGWSEYFYDGYCWVGDSPDRPTISPEYSRHLSPSRPQDVDWSLNWTRIHLSRTGKPGELRVELETFTPNLARLEKHSGHGAKNDGPTWQTTPSAFLWQLQPGANRLVVRSVNHWGKHGAEVDMTVDWQP